MTRPLLIEQSEGIMTLTLNLPEQRNPISGGEVIDALLSAVDAADRDIDVRAVIITGAGSAFCSGGNVKAMEPGSEMVGTVPEDTRRRYRRGIQQLPRLFDAIEVPVIAAVNGAAVGAGCDLACMCDIRIAAQSARFAESFVKVGLVPGDGGAWLLPRVVGYPKAIEMALTGDMVNAGQALACGLVTAVVPDDELMAAARAMARRIAANPAHAVRTTKRLMREAQLASLSTILEMSAAAQSIAHVTAEHKAAVAAFKAR